MRYLQNENDTLTFKAGDTSETIRLSARNDNQPITFVDGDTATVHVDKDNAHVKTIEAVLVFGSNNITFSTSELSDLPAGQYQLEVWVKLTSDGSQAIYPSEGMLNFTIDRNADSLEGGAITTITLDSFKDQLNKAIEEAKKQATPGKSAYQLWLDEGNKGTEHDFLASLKGEKGDAGATGETGQTGQPGLSAYQLAVNAGFKGSEAEWLDYLRKGPQGQPGQNGKDGATPSLKFGTITSVAPDQPAKAELIDNKDNSYTLNLTLPRGAKGETGGVNQIIKPELTIGTVTTVNSNDQASASLTKTSETGYAINLNIPAGKAGEQGPQGEPGKDGKNGADGQPGQPGRDGKNGVDGQPGKDGKDGKSAYDLAVQEGFKGDLKAWLASLKGQTGPAGKDGKNGQNGRDGQPGKDGKNGLNGHSIWYTSEGINWTQTNPTVTMQSVYNASDTQKPEVNDLIIDSNGDVHKITAVTNDTVTADPNRLMSVKGAAGSTPSIDPVSHHWIIDGTDTGVTAQGQDGRDGQDATSNLFVQNGMVEIGGVNYGLVSEHASSQLRQSDFSYQQDMSVRIIPQSNFKAWTGITDGHWTLDVDDNTLTNDSDPKKKIKLMTGLYLLRDLDSDVTVKSTKNLGLNSTTFVSQITQLIVTPYMVIANAVVDEYDQATSKSTIKVDAFWRSNWDSDSMPYWGVSDDWNKM